jgi:hypothetical protein
MKGAMPTAHDYISEHFRRWESRGRGWQVFAEPVHPEPPFQAFAIPAMTETPAEDDGCRPTFLGSLVQKLSRAVSAKPPALLAVSEAEEEPDPVPLVRDSLVELQVSLPADLDIDRESFEQFFRNVALCHEPLAFELLGTQSRVLAEFAASAADVPLVRRQLQAHFPDTMFRQQKGTLEQAWLASEGDEVLAVEFGLEREFMLPLARGKIDPFVSIVGALADLQPGELGLFQVLWQPVQHRWAENILGSVTKNDGRPLFINYPELILGAEEKISQPLYAAVVRVLLRTPIESRLQEIARELAGSLRAFANPKGNALIPLDNDGYPFEDHIKDVLYRQSRRTGMVLNSNELTGFVHLPSNAVRSPALQRDSGKTKAAPAIVRQAPGGIFLGDNEHGGEIISVYLSPDQRVRHTHIIGQSGTGKSTLLFNLIRQDIEHGEGVGVLDPHGDLIEQILGVIPENRIDDVVLVNPSDVEFPIGFNILQAHSEEEKNLLASDLVSVFRRLSTSWGDQMDAVLQNAILAFLESNRGGTLADLRRFLLEAPFRGEFLQTVQDPELIYYWQKVFPQLTGGRSVGPVLIRLQDFFSRKPLRNMVSQPANKLDFGHIMDSGKIFLAKLSEGLLGKENSYLLGTLLISKFQQLAMARQAQNVAARRDFWIYIDEFYNFITPSMAEILQGARKYRIGLTLAHHNLRQLERQAEVASAVMTHPCTRIVFQVGDEDAKKLAECFESFEGKSLKTLEKFHAIARVERNDFDFNLSFRKPEMPEKAQTDRVKDEVIAVSRSKYATPRAVIEAALLASIRGEKEPPEGIQSVEVPKLPSLTFRPTSPFRPEDSESKPAELQKPTVSETKDAKPQVSAIVEKPEQPDTDETDTQHSALKKQIGSEAETLDYTATFEESVLNGQGRIDVVLRRGNQAVACEVSVTNTVDYEVWNILKCGRAGFLKVAFVCQSRRKLSKIKQLFAQSAPANPTYQVDFFVPEEFLAKLFDWAAEDPAGAALERGKPRKQKIALDAGHLSEADRKKRESEWLSELRKAMKR